MKVEIFEKHFTFGIFLDVKVDSNIKVFVGFKATHRLHSSSSLGYFGWRFRRGVFAISYELNAILEHVKTRDFKTGNHVDEQCAMSVDQTMMLRKNKLDIRRFKGTVWLFSIVELKTVDEFDERELLCPIAPECRWDPLV